MHIHTSSNNTYSYLRQTNEIVSGMVEDEVYQWQFDPLASFSTMPAVYMYIIGLTEQCNLRCTYCCYSGEYKNNRSHGIHSMTQNDIGLILDFIQQETTQRPIRIAFYGGEPLLHFSLIEYAVKRGRERWRSEVAFSISTNGTLLTPEKVDWLVANSVELAISIDGTEAFHNHNRVDSQGNGSYTKVYNALSYIKNTYPDYIQNIALQMTLPSFRNLAQIAKEWHKDDILKNIALSNIHGLSPNFNKGVEKVNYEQVKELYFHLLNVYQNHQDWLVLKVFFEQAIAYWKDRPVVDVGDSVPMSTCMPVNTKLYIDTELQIGVCEKMSDNYRIGSVRNGIDWDKANELVREYYGKRAGRCSLCPAVRMCNMCLTAVEYEDAQWDVLCHNEQVYAKVLMWLFCEMAEKRLIK